MFHFFLPLVLTTAASAAPPALPPPFQDLDGICPDPHCQIRVYAPRGAGLKLNDKDAVGGVQRLGVVALGPGLTRCLAFDPGPSEDPQLAILPAASCAQPEGGGVEPELTLGGVLFIVAGNGNVYSGGDSDAKFDIRRKWVRSARGEWREAPQPFYYVGRKVRVVRVNPLGEVFPPVKLLADRKSSAEVVAVIAPGQRVEILLATEGPTSPWFLVRTEFGLVGWYESPGAKQTPDALNIFFHGD